MSARPPSFAQRWNRLDAAVKKELLDKWQEDPRWTGQRANGALTAFAASMFADFNNKLPQVASEDPKGWEKFLYQKAKNAKQKATAKTPAAVSQKAMQSMFPPQKSRAKTARSRFVSAHQAEIDAAFNSRKGDDEKQNSGMCIKLWHKIVNECIAEHAEEYEAFKQETAGEDEDEEDEDEEGEDESGPLPNPEVIASLKVTAQHILDWWAVHTGFTFVLGVVGNDGHDDVVACYDDRISNFLGANPEIKAKLEDALVAHVVGNRDTPQSPQFVPSRVPSPFRGPETAQDVPVTDLNGQDTGNGEKFDEQNQDAMETQTTSRSPTPEPREVWTPASPPKSASPPPPPVPPSSPPPRSPSAPLNPTPRAPAAPPLSAGAQQDPVDPPVAVPGEVAVPSQLAEQKDAVRKLVEKPGGRWMKNDIKFLLDSSDAAEWIKLLGAWVEYELKHPNHRQRLISENLRPNVYKVFWTRNRLKQPSDGDLSTFHREFLTWYVSLQPQARKPGGITSFGDLKPASIVDKGAYGDLYVVGGRGIVVILFGIAWLFRAGTGVPICDVHATATAAALASDTCEIINVLCAPVGDNGVSRRCVGVPGPEHAPAASTKKRKVAPESDEQGPKQKKAATTSRAAKNQKGKGGKGGKGKK